MAKMRGLKQDILTGEQECTKTDSLSHPGQVWCVSDEVEAG